MVTCVICDHRPRAEGSRFCHNCGRKLEAEARRRGNGQPYRFLTYRGHVVGLFENGDGKLRGRLLNREPAKLPKGKTLDLNSYLPGFTRDQVKRFKAAVLKLAAAGILH